MSAASVCRVFSAMRLLSALNVLSLFGVARFFCCERDVRIAPVQRVEYVERLL